MDSAGELATWVEAANEASFAFYEVKAPQPEDRWAGGYGWRSATDIVELAIHHEVDGSEIVVTTTVLDREVSTNQTEAIVRHGAFVSLMSGVFGYDELEPLPLVLGFAEAAATIMVDGTDVSFDGIEGRKNGELSGWSGHAVVDGVRVTVTVAPGPVAGIVLGPCTNWAMSDGPKQRRG